METAPRDGSYFIAGYYDDICGRKAWVCMCNYELGAFNAQEQVCEPDFWMPIPNPPKQ
jgi:hypothetical protein